MEADTDIYTPICLPIPGDKIEKQCFYCVCVDNFPRLSVSIHNICASTFGTVLHNAFNACAHNSFNVGNSLHFSNSLHTGTDYRAGTAVVAGWGFDQVYFLFNDKQDH